LDGETRTSTSGAAAPTEKVAADANAACIRQAVVIAQLPSSSQALDLSEFFPLEPMAVGRLPFFACGIGMLGIGLELTETYSPVAIDMATFGNDLRQYQTIAVMIDI
jgi:hypothetical protein